MSGSRSRTACVAIGLVTLAGGPVWAVTFETMNGAPVQMQSMYDEPGAPTVTVPLGTAQPFTSAGGSTGSTGGGTTGGSEALTTMLGTSWGSDAAGAAMAIGINPSVLAATCVVETNCQNISGPGTVSGAFQMTNSTYTQDMRQVVAQNPNLASVVDTSLAGKMNPGNQAYGAAQDLKNAATSLQSAGIANPTFTDARAYFQWGAGAGPSVALADPNQNMASLLSPYYTQAQLSGNGVTSTTTVGQWRTSFANKVGSAATQQVLM